METTPTISVVAIASQTFDKSKTCYFIQLFIYSSIVLSNERRIDGTFHPILSNIFWYLSLQGSKSIIQRREISGDGEMWKIVWTQMIHFWKWHLNFFLLILTIRPQVRKYVEINNDHRGMFNAISNTISTIFDIFRRRNDTSAFTGLHQVTWSTVQTSWGISKDHKFFYTR
jgi:hypothetical protein